jgi:accessory gene regulator protein AgrB
MHVLQLHCLATDFLYLRAFARHGPHRKHSFPSIVASLGFYRAVAWQDVEKIRYNSFSICQILLLLIIHIQRESKCPRCDIVVLLKIFLKK